MHCAPLETRQSRAQPRRWCETSDHSLVAKLWLERCAGAVLAEHAGYPTCKWRAGHPVLRTVYASGILNANDSHCIRKNEEMLQTMNFCLSAWFCHAARVTPDATMDADTDQDSHGPVAGCSAYAPPSRLANHPSQNSAKPMRPPTRVPLMRMYCRSRPMFHSIKSLSSLASQRLTVSAM